MISPVLWTGKRNGQHGNVLLAGIFLLAAYTMGDHFKHQVPTLRIFSSTDTLHVYVSLNTYYMQCYSLPPFPTYFGVYAYASTNIQKKSEKKYTKNMRIYILVWSRYY